MLLSQSPAAPSHADPLTFNPSAAAPTPLECTDYPDVPYWTKHQWDHRSENGNLHVEDADDGESPSESLGFVTNTQGTTIKESKAQAIRSTTHGAWKELVNKGVDPPTWGGAPLSVTNYFHKVMYKAHPELTMCENHWKLNTMASIVYPGWHRNPKNLQPDVKSEWIEPVDEERSSILAPATKHKCDKESEERKLHKKHKKKPSEAPSVATAANLISMPLVAFIALANHALVDYILNQQGRL